MEFGRVKPHYYDSSPIRLTSSTSPLLACPFPRASRGHGAALISVSLALSRTIAETARPQMRGYAKSKKKIKHVLCQFTPQLSLVLINRPRRDGTLSWRWYTAATGGIRTHDLAIASPATYHSATAYPYVMSTISKNTTKMPFLDVTPRVEGI